MNNQVLAISTLRSEIPKSKYRVTVDQRKNDWIERFRGKDSNGHLDGMDCPNCNKKKLHSSNFNQDKGFLKAECWSCKHEIRHSEEFPERYPKDFYKEFQKQNPDTLFKKLSAKEKALEYLSFRGIPTELINSDLVKVEDMGKGEAVWFLDSSGDFLNGRFLDPQSGNKSDNKENSQISIKYFKPCDIYNRNKPVYIAEAPIKALALVAMGLQAISIYSAHLNEANKLFTDFKGYELKGAFDSDEAGIRALKDLVRIQKGESKNKDNKIDEGHLVNTSNNQDWDDYLRLYGIPKEEEREKLITEWGNHGYVALASSAQDYIKRRIDKGFKVYPVFIFNGSTYGVDNEEKVFKYFDAVISRESTEITLDDTGEKNHSWGLRVKPKKGQPYLIRNVQANELTGESFSTLLLRKAQVVVLADTRRLKQYTSYLLNRGTGLTTSKLNYAGYHLETGYILTPHWGVSKEGKLIQPDNMGSYSISGQTENITPLATRQFPIKLKDPKTAEERQAKARTFITEFCKAYPIDGGLLLSLYIASIWSPLFKDSGVGFPFVELVGEAGTGKTDRMRLLLEMSGLESQGFSFKAANPKAWKRGISHLSGFPCFVDESNEEDPKRTIRSIEALENEILPLYKGGVAQSQGVKDNSNSTITYLFRSNFFFCCNHTPFKGQAIKERVHQIRVAKEYLEIDGASEAFTRLMKMSPDDRLLAGIGIIEMMNPIIHERWEAKRDDCREELNNMGYRDPRIVEDTALILGINTLINKAFQIDLPEFDLYQPSSVTSEAPKILYHIKSHLAKVRKLETSALNTLIGALVEIGVIDLSRDDLKGEPSNNNEKMFTSWKTGLKTGQDGLFVYLYGMANDLKRFPTLSREKEQVEHELKRLGLSSVSQRIKSGKNGSVLCRGYVIPLKILQSMTQKDD